jgi:single-stranded-DNA-specific exonuclease
LLAQLFAARGVNTPDELETQLQRLLPPDTLRGATEAAQLLANAIERQQHLCIVADYDCDGATACAVGVRGLRLLGAQRVSFVVPDRQVDGYGLTPPIAERVQQLGADVLITVDNGIASLEGVSRAQALGLQVLVTDHHLPGSELPTADVIVNPNQPDCPFASKHLAGVGVMFYVLMALRAEQRRRGHLVTGQEPRLDTLLPLVALGTVADVVRLDANNRRLVAQGLNRVRKGQMPAGMTALFEVAGRDARRASSQDFGFAVGPRLNAAGRLSDMTLGIECLLTDDPTRAQALALALDRINRERRELESDMREQALARADTLLSSDGTPPSALCVFNPDFHEGVVGIVASRLKDQHHRPSFVFARSESAQHGPVLKGSGRSIPGFHLRDALDLLSKRHPGVLLQFGGHAMAAGCSIAPGRFDDFQQGLQAIATEWLSPSQLTRCLDIDGPLPPEHRRADVADLLQQQVWGQGFAAPTFCDTLDVVGQRVVGERHLSLRLRHQGQAVDGIWFGRSDPLPATATLAYRLEVDEWQGARRVRFVIESEASPSES